MAATPHTVTTHARLDSGIATVVARGYSTETEEPALGRACVAAPIRDGSGAVVAGLSVSGPLPVIEAAKRMRALAK